jgi:MEMO1 family protein
MSHHDDPLSRKDPKQYPVLRNLQFSPIKEGEDQFIVLWDPDRSEQRETCPAAQLLFFIVQHFDGEHSIAGDRRAVLETFR